MATLDFIIQLVCTTAMALEPLAFTTTTDTEDLVTTVFTSQKRSLKICRIGLTVLPFIMNLLRIFMMFHCLFESRNTKDFNIKQFIISKCLVLD